MISQKGVDDNYWSRRSDMMYYKYIDILIKAFAFDAQTIIDVGSANTRYIERCHWIPKKFTLDIKKPYASPEVTAIEADFLTFTPNEKYDFVTCFQVLEHIPEAEIFARKLLEVSDRVLISVPYLWPKGAEDEHVNDPVDEKKLNTWFGREPSYSIIVAEPLRIPSKGISRRLICYYGPKEEEVNYKKVNDNVYVLKGKETSHQEQKNQDQKLIQNKLNEILIEQERNYQLLKLELEIFNIDSALKDKVLVNQQMDSQMGSLRKEINHYKTLINRENKQQQYYKKEYNKILQSNSWKLMVPMRKVGSFLRGTLRKFK